MKNKNYLDERQEHALLKSESKGYWLAYWLLLAVVLVQVVVESINVNIHIPSFAGEWIVLMVLCLYMVIKCSKNNIWARGLKPTFKTNLIFSIIAGAVSGITCFVIVYVKSQKIIGSIAATVFIFVLTSGLCLAALSISAASYKKKKRLLEDAEEAETEE